VPGRLLTPDTPGPIVSLVPDGSPPYAPLPSDGTPHVIDDVPGVTVNPEDCLCIDCRCDREQAAIERYNAALRSQMDNYLRRVVDGPCPKPATTTRAKRKRRIQ